MSDTERTSDPTHIDLASAEQALAKEMKDGSLKSLIEMNIKWSQVIYAQNKRLNRRLTAMAVANYLRLLIILAPIVLAIVFLPPLLKDLYTQYEQVLNPGSGGQIGLDELLELLQGSADGERR